MRRPGTKLRYITTERNASRSFSLIFGYGYGEIRVFRLHPIHRITKPPGISQYLVVLLPRSWPSGALHLILFRQAVLL
jgi:hypothetical protein